jgi:hypothetical protein
VARNHAPPSDAPNPKDQVNFTDPESHIMPASGGGFEQCDNAQAAVELESRLIVGQRASDAPNDKEELMPSLAAVEAAAGPVAEVLIDSGFVSEAAVRTVESGTDGQPNGLRVLAAMSRERHGRRVGDLEKNAAPAALDPAALDPAALDPAALDPATLDPAAPDPATPDPATLDPATLDPATLDPATLDPAAFDPATPPPRGANT